MHPVTVVIPTYNRSGILKTALDSVLNQTWQDFELMVVDDGSTDNTAAMIAENYAKRVRYIYQENRGAAAARNTGIKAATHDLVAFLDSDDQFDKRKLELQVAAMLQEPQYLVSHTQEIWFRRGKFLNQKKKHRKESGYIFERCLELCAVGMSTIMARKSLFDEVGLFDEGMPCCEDYDLWLRASVKHQFLLVDQPLTIKDGGRPDQLSCLHRVGMDRYRINSIHNLLNTEKLKSEQRELAVRELVKKCTIYGNGCLKHGREREGNKYLQLAETFRPKIV